MRYGVLAFFLVAAATSSCGVLSCGADRAAFNPSGADASVGPGGFDTSDAGCVGFACNRVQCDPGKTTTLKGRVYDPAGANPLYNVAVYIPSGDPTAPLPPLDDATAKGVTCSPCSGIVLSPLASALTDTSGDFVLQDVPVGKDVPVVVQVGKWRRRFTVDITERCSENTMKGEKLTLPKNGSEGDMPQIAVTTGALDALECLLRGIGIDDAEFVPGPGGAGHVHVFNGGSGDFMGKYAGAPTADTLWNSTTELKKYDMTLLSCEGAEWRDNKGGFGAGEVAAMPGYLDAGGRVFATHYHYVWFGESPDTSLRSVATFDSASPLGESGPHDVNTSFPKGEAFATWLQNVGASKVLGKIDLSDVRNTVTSMGAPSTSWITVPSTGLARYFSFNTPVTATPDAQCGRAVFSDLHVTGSVGPAQISGCPIEPGKLAGQQQALEFFFFDLAACVSDDKVPPPQPK